MVRPELDGEKKKIYNDVRERHGLERLVLRYQWAGKTLTQEYRKVKRAAHMDVDDPPTQHGMGMVK